MTFEWPDGVKKQTVQANIGDTLFDVVLDNDVDIDGFGIFTLLPFYQHVFLGACNAKLACSTCHLILPDDVYDKLPNPPSEEELDLLDTAPLITDT